MTLLSTPPVAWEVEGKTPRAEGSSGRAGSAAGAGPRDRGAEAARGLEAAVASLLSKQAADGHWCAELEGDSILNTEYLLMKVILGQDQAPAATAEELGRFERLCTYVEMLQRPDGTWGQYPGSPADISATVKAYFALKLWGRDPESPAMRRARERVLAMGGAEKINTFSMFYLACLGQVSWDACPAIPPEIVLLPRWFPFHLDKVAAWTRTMILPLGLCSALRPVRRLPSARGIGELFVDHAKRSYLSKPWDRTDPVSWTNVFLVADRALKRLQKWGLMPLRSMAIGASERWLLDRMRSETTDGLGAIFPPMVYIQVALQAMGYPREHPVIRLAEKELDRFFVEAEATRTTPAHTRIQPCFSPVWDTGIALYGLTEAGLTAGDERVARVCRWLCDHEVSIVGDWARNMRAQDRPGRMGPGGDAAAWAFEYRNEWYPDVDDSAMVCKALWRAAADPAAGKIGARSRDAARRGVRWIMAMQNEDGGWAAFDRTTHREWMEKVPFADHNAMQDPSCADITGRTLEALVTCGVPTDDAVIRRAVAYLRREQREQGCWWGRWGCNFLYGTWQAVGGLVAVGMPGDAPELQRALAWLRSVQNPDGGFGESANSYLDESLMGKGPSTASQTAWGVISLMNILGERSVEDEGVGRAIDYLCATQLKEPAPAEPPTRLHDEPAGSWVEPWFTGTGFPKVFYLRYHLYRHYFPVIALGRFVRLGRAGRGN
ncbi:MAG: squalene--hopene cyclase [Planctomycetota bacterium]|nr:squalene--hopene cyclase [Planctomycetota bacterium]